MKRRGLEDTKSSRTKPAEDVFFHFVKPIVWLFQGGNVANARLSFFETSKLVTIHFTLSRVLECQRDKLEPLQAIGTS
jgi:hypothetical protein